MLAPGQPPDRDLQSGLPECPGRRRRHAACVRLAARRPGHGPAGAAERLRSADRRVGQICASFPDWGLAILGEGSQRANLAAQIEKLGLADRIQLPGTTASPAATLRSGDLFVLSSRYEGFGLTLVEAMACGLPVIATDCPSGPAEIIHHGHDGILFLRKTLCLAKAMAGLMSDADERRRLAQNAPAAAQRFNLDDVMRTWEQVIDAVWGVRMASARRRWPITGSEACAIISRFLTYCPIVPPS